MTDAERKGLQMKSLYMGLRIVAAECDENHTVVADHCNRAADEIERLSATVAKLTAALAVYADGKQWHSLCQNEDCCIFNPATRFSRPGNGYDLARRVLAEAKGGQA